MAMIRKKGDKSPYSVYDRDCLGRACLSIGHYQTRGATLSGSRSTGDCSPCCMTRAYHGCPSNDKELYTVNLDLIKQRKSEGMKVI